MLQLEDSEETSQDQHNNDNRVQVRILPIAQNKFMITHHTTLLNALIEKYNLKSYLEIGVQNPANNFNLIKCKWKQGVDPDVKTDLVWTMTSDDFFENVSPINFDLIFIDGLHHAGQVKRDFENSLRCLNDNGFIVIHDVLPTDESTTHVPRDSKIWHGDVYQFAMTIGSYNGIQFITYNIDNGCMVVGKNPNRIAGLVADKYNWDTYITIGRTLMNVTDEVII